MSKKTVWDKINTSKLNDEEDKANDVVNGVLDVRRRGTNVRDYIRLNVDFEHWEPRSVSSTWNKARFRHKIHRDILLNIYPYHSGDNDIKFDVFNNAGTFRMNNRRQHISFHSHLNFEDDIATIIPLVVNNANNLGNDVNYYMEHVHQ